MDVAHGNGDGLAVVADARAGWDHRDGVVTVGGISSCAPLPIVNALCEPAGLWDLTYSDPDHPCPFGGETQTLSLEVTRESVCVRGGDFRTIASGTGGCEFQFSGGSTSRNPSETYVSEWTATLRFSAGSATGSYVYKISGGSNCTRRFKAQGMRRSVDAGGETDARD